MRTLSPVLLSLVSALLFAAPARADVTLSPERQAFMEGVWSGVDAMTDASKLCSAESTSSKTLAFEFLRTGGLIFSDDGSDVATRASISDAHEENGLISVTFNETVWRFRPTSANVMARVRHSASLGSEVDDVVFKRCQPPADRSAISLDTAQLQLLAADMPGEGAFFVDKRLAKSAASCMAEETQYVYFALVGPSEFRLSRWNSFSLADKLASKKAVKLPIDPVMNWRITGARADGGRYVFQVKDYDKPDAAVETIHLEAGAPGEFTIPEWKRTFLRCTGFQNRS